MENRVRVILFSLLVLLPQGSWAALRDYSFNSGYLESTQGERDEAYTDLVLMPEPPPLGPSFNDRIFNPQLNKEFKEKYEQQFGHTEEEQIYLSPNRYTYYNDIDGQGLQQEDYAAHQQYGQYVLRRLGEYHVDNYAKSDPSVRPLWEAKERLSKVNVQVEQVKVDFEYSISGNTFDMKFTNPWLSMAKVRLQMDPGSFGPTNVQETIVSLGRNVTPKISLESYYYVTNGVVSLIGRRPLRPGLAASLTLSTFTNTTGTTVRQSLYLAGLTYSF